MTKIDLHPLTVGPIVGAVSTDTARLFGRGEFDPIGSLPRRCFGAARLWPAADAAAAQTCTFKMNPNFDFTGVAIFTGLEPATDYRFQMGWFFADGELSDFDAATPLDWAQASDGAFRTAAADTTAERSFVFGSCRYLLRLFGIDLFDDRGDKTFRSIVAQLDQGRHIDAFLMLGDQIYADDLDDFHADERLVQYNARYRAAFCQPYLRQLMSRVPTYMTLDDHEIEDGWPERSDRRDWLRKFPAAIHAYQTYQLSHSPFFALAADAPRLVGTPEKLWYTFADGCCDFFVTDTRTERFINEDESRREIMSREQLTALERWLTDGSERVKVIASSVPVFPDYRNRGEEPWSGLDKWRGFLDQRTRLLELVREHRPQRVLCLSGDSHLSLSAELVNARHPEVKVISVISSPFFWPYPKPRRDKFELTGELATSPAGLGYQLRNCEPVYDTDNFTRLTIDLEKVRVEVFSRKGEPLGEKVHRFTGE